MAKRVDPLKAKAAKQKKIAIGGFILLLALLGVQGPKTLKMLKGPQPVTTAATTAPAATTPVATPATGAATPATAGAAPTTAAAELTAVADSDLSPEVAQGQLATFERFASKDPFAQQAQPVEKAPAPAAAPKPATDTTPADASKGSGSGSTSGGTTTDGGFTTGGSTPTGPTLAAATSISVNGVAEDVQPEGTFPKADPTFVLAKVAKNGKSVEIGIAGGETRAAARRSRSCSARS